jgi:hypothetical protein
MPNRKEKPGQGKTKRKLPRSISFTGRLLGLQSLGFVALAFFIAPAPPIPAHEISELWLPALYLLLAFLSAAAALGLLRLRPLAWDVAMLLEGVALFEALALYLGERPFYAYLLMFYGIIVVINLNHPELRRSFPTEIIEEQTETHKEHRA